MDAFLGFVIYFAILIGLAAGIISLVKAKLRQAKKWRQLKRWARAQDYALPKKTGPLGAFLIIIGLFLGVIPGLVLIYVAIRRDQNYEKEMRLLMNKWVDAGKPLPPST